MTFIIVAAFVLIVVCVADWLPDRKPPKGYCCEASWRYGTCTCPDREQQPHRW